jgi:hypothetical protein
MAEPGYKKNPDLKAFFIISLHALKSGFDRILLCMCALI